MLFYTFNSQEERRRFGGSDFIEIQFCRLPDGTALNKAVEIDSIKPWQNDSLYIADDVGFFHEYSSIFDCGVYNNLKSGTVDLCGINYYIPSLTDNIIEKICKNEPDDYEILVEWLIKSKAYNGFYILGL